MCVNDAPIVNANSYTTTQNISKTVAAPGVLTNDTDAEGDSFVAVLVNGPANGTLETNSGWIVQELVAEGSMGSNNSIAIINGHPAISYYDNDHGDLKYIRAADAQGVTWGQPVTVTSAGNVGASTSLAIVNNTPAISYQDNNTKNLMFIRSDTSDGTTWPAIPIIVDATAQVGNTTNLLIVNGQPAIAYYDRNSSSVKYVRAIDASGSSWDTPCDN